MERRSVYLIMWKIIQNGSRVFEHVFLPQQTAKQMRARTAEGRKERKSEGCRAGIKVTDVTCYWVIMLIIMQHMDDTAISWLGVYGSADAHSSEAHM